MGRSDKKDYTPSGSKRLAPVSDSGHKAWVISITVHLILISIFSTVKFSSGPVNRAYATIPSARISQIRNFVKSQPVIPKPKVIKAVKTYEGDDNPAYLSMRPDKEFIVKAQGYSTEKITAGRGRNIVVNNAVLPAGIEFFGSSTKERRICFVVDCSGSMQGIFGQVRRKLKDSIEKLQPDQYFALIFFAGARLIEYGNGELVRASSKNKSGALEFIDSIRPYGVTNALQAIRKAMSLRDQTGTAAGVIYFLTDGFELSDEDTRRFVRRVENLRKYFAPSTKINTIGFWIQRSDRSILETIAKQSGGEFVSIDTEWD